MSIEVASTMPLLEKKTMTDKVLLMEVASLSTSSTLLVLLTKLKLKDSEDSFLDPPGVSPTCTSQLMKTKLMLETQEDPSTSLCSKTDQPSKRRSRESVTHSQDKDTRFQNFLKFQRTSRGLVPPLQMLETYTARLRSH